MKMMNLLQLFAVLGKMGLEIRLESRCQFCRAAHHFLRASYREPRTEGIFE